MIFELAQADDNLKSITFEATRDTFGFIVQTSSNESNDTPFFLFFSFFSLSSFNTQLSGG